jgi:hypothetical protein
MTPSPARGSANRPTPRRRGKAPAYEPGPPDGVEYEEWEPDCPCAVRYCGFIWVRFRYMGDAARYLRDLEAGR